MGLLLIAIAIQSHHHCTCCTWHHHASLIYSYGLGYHLRRQQCTACVHLQHDTSQRSQLALRLVNRRLEKHCHKHPTDSAFWETLGRFSRACIGQTQQPRARPSLLPYRQTLCIQLGLSVPVLTFTLLCLDAYWEKPI